MISDYPGFHQEAKPSLDYGLNTSCPCPEDVFLLPPSEEEIGTAE